MEKNLQELIMEHEPHVSLDIANLLKQAGFDWNCQGFYKENVFYSGSIEYCSNYHYQESVYAKAPSFYVAQRWLREVKNISVDVLHQHNGWVFGITDLSNDSLLTVKLITSSTYEQALETGINKVLELILEKGK